MAIATVLVALVGVPGVASATGALSFSPSSVFFPEQALGVASGSVTVTATNASSSSVTITSVTVSGTDAGDFAVLSPSSGGCAGATLGTSPHTDSCTVTVSFTPSAYGWRQATLDFNSVTSQSIALDGTVQDSYSRTVDAAAPSSYWRLDEQSGSVASDSSGNGNTGTYQSGVTLGVAGAETCTPAETAASFNGSTGNVTTTTSYSDPTSFTIEAWFKTTSTSSGIIGFSSSQIAVSASYYDRSLYVNSAGELSLYIYTGSYAVTLTSSAAVDDGNWHFAAATVNSGNLALYLDGALVASGSGTPQSYTGYWRVGLAGVGGSALFMNGTISEAAFIASPLTVTTLAGQYSAATACGSSLSFTAPSSLGFSGQLDGYDERIVDAAPVEVTSSGSAPGWNLTASASSQSSGTSTLPVGALSLNGSSTSALSTSAPAASCVGSCTLPSGNTVNYPVTVLAGAPAVTLATASSGSASGTVQLALDWWIAVPADATPASYSGTISLTLASGP